MRPFAYETASASPEAVRLYGAGAEYLAGGTTLLDLMKLDVMRPQRVIDINGLPETFSRIDAEGGLLRLGALARMSDVAENAIVQRAFPVISQSLQQAASAQLRNMATIGGNVLQRTRCSYYRDPTWASCNKRNPGSGCSALDGVNRKHAVLGASENCIATYPGDFAQALVALDASVEILGSGGARKISFESLHREPGDHPELENNLRLGDLITAFVIPMAPWTQRSLYLKVRDRQSYEFALASAAVALEMNDGRITQARIALGGVATKPWRAREAEAKLAGAVANTEAFEAAAQLAFAGAKAHGDNSYKIALGRRTLVRALDEASRIQVQ